MLQLNVIMSESFNEETNSFITETWPLKLEHSLVSLSKWESKYEKPFLESNNKSEEEILDYITMMDLEEESPPEVFSNLSNEDYNRINTYINAKMTATWFNRKNKPKGGRQVITSELIYYWITSYEIPWTVEMWHLNRLFTLIEVFNEEHGSRDNKTKRRSGTSLAEERRALNESRRRQLGTNG